MSMLIKKVGGGGALLPGDSQWADVKLLVQPHNGDASDATALVDRGPDGRTATIGAGSVTITDDYNRSPVWGAYANPSSASVTWSDDAGLEPGTGDFCIEAIVNRQATGAVSENSLYTSNSAATRQFQGYFFDGNNWYWYKTGGTSLGPGNLEPGDGYDTANGPMNENVTVDRSSGTTRIFWNGNLVLSGSDTDNYDTAWAAFKLFTDGTSFFGGNLIALRLTHASRYTTAHNAMLHGFPEGPA